jgi:hypothetical protein
VLLLVEFMGGTFEAVHAFLLLPEMVGHIRFQKIDEVQNELRLAHRGVGDPHQALQLVDVPDEDTMLLVDEIDSDMVFLAPVQHGSGLIRGACSVGLPEPPPALAHPASFQEGQATYQILSAGKQKFKKL